MLKKNFILVFFTSIIYASAFTQPGALDRTFGNDGTVYFELLKRDGVSDILIQPDGKILLTGSSRGYDNLTDLMSLTRLNTTGSVDFSVFAYGQYATWVGNSLALQPDGKIIVTGYADLGLASWRYNTNGSPDSTFGSNGMITFHVNDSYSEGKSAVLQPDGKIIITGYAGNDLALWRYDFDGSADSTFGSNGIITFHIGNSYSSGNSVAL